MSDTDLPGEIVLPIRFHLEATPEHFEALRVRARSIDAHNAGMVAVEYTPEQALTVVFHEEGIEGLREIGLLVGWTVDTDMHWGQTRPATDEDESEALVQQVMRDNRDQPGFDRYGALGAIASQQIEADEEGT